MGKVVLSDLNRSIMKQQNVPLGHTVLWRERKRRSKF